MALERIVNWLRKFRTGFIGAACAEVMTPPLLRFRPLK
jgi:hypothetical protein